MATVTGSHFVSRTSHGAETKANLSQTGLRNQSMTHNGLRFLNKVDRLQMRTNAKAVARNAVKDEHPTANDKLSGKIICGTGMNIIFVGAEVGPWSKTGGLGDVLGGLPPAMAVSIRFTCNSAHYVFFLLHLQFSVHFVYQVCDVNPHCLTLIRPKDIVL